MSSHTVMPSDLPPLSSENVVEETYLFPMSSAQERLWFLDQLKSGTSAFNLPIAMRVDGPLDETILERALQMVIDRHEVLRTTFDQIDDELVQIVHANSKFRLHLIDVSSGSDASVDDLIDTEVRRAFDLKNGPLFRGTLYKHSPNEHTLLLNMHHIVADGWSFAVILREMGTFYESIRNGTSHDLAELPIQYADYSQWQQEYCSGEEFESKLDHWKRVLAGAPQSLDLPIAKPRPIESSLKGSTISVLLPAELTEAVIAFSRREGCTLFMTLMSCFNVLLYRYTGEPDLVVGTPVANRNLTEIEDLVGCFVNTAIYRTQVSGEVSFLDVLSKVREWSLEAYQYQDVPLEILVEKLQPDRRLDRTPLFQHLFIYQKAFIQPILLSDLTFAPFRVDRKGSQLDMTFFVLEREEGLRLACEFREDLFDTAAIGRFLEHYQTLLRSAVGIPSMRIGELPILTESEKQNSVTRRGIAQLHPTVQIHRLFEDQASRRPDAVAVSYGGEEFTYAELNRRANRLARRLAGSSVGPDIPVAICMDRSIEMVVAILAVLKAGGMYVPLDPGYPDERLRYVLNDCGAQVAIARLDHGERIRSLAPHVAVLDPDSPPTETEPDGNLDFRGSAHDLAYLIYTSGSTGNPKGVMVTHQNVVRLLRSTEHWFGFNETDVWTLFHSFAFDFSVWEIWGALAYGGRLVIVPYEVIRSPGDFYKLLCEEGVTVLNQTPSAFRSLANCSEAMNPADQPAALRYIIFGGEALDFRILQPWIESHRGVPTRLINMYGITETTVHVTFREISESDIGSANGSLIGEPIPDLALYILDQHMEPVPVGVPGEMYVAGAGLARGYLNRPELTAERFVENPYGEGDYARLYKTGDRARYTENGDIEYLGRADNQVKIRGFRIELGEIEAAIGEFDDVSEAVVTVTTAEDGDKRLAAYFVSASESKIESAELRGYLKTKLPDHMIPAAFVQLERIPLTANGKVDRKSLPEPTVTLSAERNGSEEPKTETERALLEIWQKLFGVENIGVHDDFFELGGHSLMAIKMFAAVEKRFGKKPPLAVLFESGTIKTLARSIAESLWEDSDPSLVPIQPNGTRPPLYCFHAGGGNVLFYSDLAKRMGSDQPIYGLQARRSGNRQLAHDTVEDMAAYYLAEITRFQPNGPYYLCGSSFGGLLALETAQILLRSGRDVGLVALFDTNGPGYPRLLKETTAFRRRLYAYLRRFEHHRESLAALDAAGRRTYIISRFEKVKLKSKRRLRKLLIRSVELFYSRFRDGKELPKQYLQLENKIGEANKRYQPRPYPGKVTLFRAEKQPLGIVPDPTLGWSEVVESLEVHEIPGHHGSIVAEPYVGNLAMVLRECLDLANTRRRIGSRSLPVDRNGEGKEIHRNGSAIVRRGAAVITID